MRLKIIFICNEYPPVLHGGIGSFTKSIAEFLSNAKHEVIVIGFGSSESNQEELINGVRVIRLKLIGKTKCFLIRITKELVVRYILYKAVSRLASKFKPDLIETYDWSAPLVYKISGLKHVIRLHGSNTAFRLYAGFKPSVFMSQLERRALKISDFAISVSDHVSLITQTAFKLNLPTKTIYNGVNTLSFKDRNLERDKNQLLLVGRMHPNKGFEDLFSSLNIILARKSDVYLTIICTIIESYRAKLLLLVNKIHHSRIIFIGRIPNEDLPVYYNRANLTILPSRVEALPIIPLESMACGTPVIMSDRFSAREIIDDKIDGFLVNTSNPESLAKEVLKILEDQKSIEAMREKAREKILNKFSMDKTLKDNLLFYKNVVNSK